jgi:tetratricopeptide (TPR) repeat protein
MPARRSWLRADRWLLYANFVVYATVLVLVSAFHGDLRWAARTVDAYLRTDNFQSTADGILVRQAIEYEKTHPDDLDRVESLLVQALAIDPNGQALLRLASVRERRGEADEALKLYRRYLSIDPYAIHAYAAISGILESRGELDALEALLAKGVEQYRIRVARFEPRPDPTVQQHFNLKAAEVHERLRQGLGLLEANLARIRESR